MVSITASDVREIETGYDADPARSAFLRAEAYTEPKGGPPIEDLAEQRDALVRSFVEVKGVEVKGVQVKGVEAEG